MKTIAADPDALSPDELAALAGLPPIHRRAIVGMVRQLIERAARPPRTVRPRPSPDPIRAPGAVAFWYGLNPEKERSA